MQYRLRSKRFRLVSVATKDRGTGFSVLAAREMKQRSLTLVPRSLLLNRTETFAMQARCST